MTPAAAAATVLGRLEKCLLKYNYRNFLILMIIYSHRSNLCMLEMERKFNCSLLTLQKYADPLFYSGGGPMAAAAAAASVLSTDPMTMSAAMAHAANVVGYILLIQFFFA